MRPGEDAKRVVNKDGVILFDKPGDPSSSRPEVDRGELRAMLIDSLAPDAIQWNHKAAFLASSGNDRHEITFTNGAKTTVDLLIGADGAWSKVRPLVSGAKPVYSGTCFIEIALAAGDARYAASVAVIGTGTLMAVAPGRGILAHRYPNGMVVGYVALNKPLDWVLSIDFKDARAGLALIAEQFPEWATHLTNLIKGSTADPMLRPIHALPVGLEWPHQAGVTLVGDAAHLMSPFAGEGANLAMYDGAKLARAILDYPRDIQAALTMYERALFPRSRDVAQRSAQNLALFFGDTAPDSVVDLFSRSVAPGM